jgi:membrane-associated phospholipid phosphatase
MATTSASALTRTAGGAHSARPAVSWHLIPRSVRPLAIVIALAAGGGITALSRHYYHRVGPGVLDTEVDGRVAYRLASHPWLLDQFIRIGAPDTVATVALALTVLCLAFRKWRAALFALVAPTSASALTEKVLKPLVHRTTHGDHLAFPSGHTTGAFALALTAAVLLLPHRGSVGTPSAVVRLVLGSGVLAAASGTAISLVALHWHYSTDTLGGALVALTVVVTAALLVDLVAGLTLRRRKQLRA